MTEPEQERAAAASSPPHPGEPRAAPRALYIVCMHDAINGELAGHRGCAYRSPPQPHADALALVGLLFGTHVRVAPAAPANWTRSVAGGRRTITLTPA